MLLTSTWDQDLVGDTPFSVMIAPPPQQPARYEGKSADAILRWTGPLGQVGIGLAPQIPNSYNRELSQILRNIHINNCAVLCNGGGKYAVLDRVAITNFNPGKQPIAPDLSALMLRNYDGGSPIVNVHENYWRGVNLDNCHHVNLDVTSRCNYGDGFVATNCGNLFGRLYCESNGLFNARLIDCNRFRFDAWFEDAHNRAKLLPIPVDESSIYQAQLRSCWDWRIDGQCQYDHGTALDLDPMSMACQYWPQIKPNARAFVIHQGPLKPRLHNWPSGRVEIIGDAASGWGIRIKKGAFDNLPPGTRGIMWDDPTGVAEKTPYGPGDTFMIQGIARSPNPEAIGTLWPTFYMAINGCNGSAWTIGRDANFAFAPQVYKDFDSNGNPQPKMLGTYNQIFTSLYGAPAGTVSPNPSNDIDIFITPTVWIFRKSW